MMQLYFTKCKTMKKFENGTIEINGTLYKLIDDTPHNCTFCDIKLSECYMYNLSELCGHGPTDTGKIFKKHVLEVEGLKYVAKLKTDDTATCPFCDIPKSECTRQRLIKVCSAINPHAYFKYVGDVKQNSEERKNVHKKRIFNPENCQRSIKDQFIVGDVTFTLSCHHSFEWTIAKTENGKITIEVYPNRHAAKKEYERKKRLSK